MLRRPGGRDLLKQTVDQVLIELIGYSESILLVALQKSWIGKNMGSAVL